MPQFVKVAEVPHLKPNELLQVKIGDLDITLANAGGQFFAVGGVCTHAFCYLGFGLVEGETVLCPCHYAQFNLRTGEPMDYLGREPLPLFEVRVQGNDILVATTPSSNGAHETFQ